MSGFLNRVRPAVRKACGNLPLCPWSSVLSTLDPRTLNGNPPAMHIETLEEAEGMKRLRFGSRHEFWFPAMTKIDAELWSEYSGVFWDHPANSHFYLRANTPLARGDVCLDCGACEGFFAQQALEGGAKLVVCLEPSGVMGECLNRTFAEAVQEKRARVVLAAAGAVNGHASFAFDSAQPFGGRVTADDSQPKIRVVTIDTLCAEIGLERVDFIKMDIEGAEIQAIEGAMEVLQRDHPKLAITTYHRTFDFAALKAYLTAAGYRKIRAAGITPRDENLHRPVMLHASRN